MSGTVGRRSDNPAYESQRAGRVHKEMAGLCIRCGYDNDRHPHKKTCSACAKYRADRWLYQRYGIRGMLREVHFYKDSSIAELGVLCPACGFEHNFRVDLDDHGHWQDSEFWSFNGDYYLPTFMPSMGANLRQQVEHHPICHSFVTDGQWNYLGDCSHELAGQTVPMIPPDPKMDFERRHGWHLFPWCDPKTGKPLETS